MNWDDFRVDAEPASIRMENELLRWENEHLRARIKQLQKGETKATTKAPQGMRLVSVDEHKELVAARQHLERVLRRLGRAPHGWIIRRTTAYKNLEQRWLDAL